MKKNYEELANAIILLAVKDWRKAVKIMAKKPDNISANKDKRETERFFRSDWFTVLTDVDGKMLLNQLKKEAGT